MKKPTNLKALNVFLLLISVCLHTTVFAKSNNEKNQTHKQEKHDDDHDKNKHQHKKPYKLPVAAFTATQKTFNSPYKVRFDGSASSSPVGLKIKKYFWQFGDRPNDKCSDRDLNDSKHSSIVENTYKKIGSYYVTLTVLDERGGRDSISKTITVTQAQVNQPPILKLTIKPNASGVAPFLALIDGSQTSSPQGLALNYQFNFGDGNFINSTTPMVTHEYKNPGQYTLTFKAIDSASQISTLTALITVTAPVIPADPAITAPAMVKNAPQALAQQVQFIYQGPNAVQTGVASGAIVRSSLVHGIIKDSFGNPLSGVKVTVLNKPNLGQTYSQASGEYDLVVNSSDETILNYERSGYTTSQRRILIETPDYVTAPEVMLTTLDNKMTKVMMTATSPKQTHTASPVVDSDGQRTPMILFKPGTTASLVLANGQVVSMPQISVRTTEYTVGDQGPKMMPGDLPANSGYTYAAELSSDEALALGAKSVQFSKPYIYFVDNFINVPVGKAVPLGIYNKEKGYWDAERDGVVIKILSIANGVAQIDLDGLGQVANAAKLLAWGVDNDELSTLATSYPVGKTLWRFRINHFSSIDGNFLAIGDSPHISNSITEPGKTCKSGSPCRTCGCVIDIASRVWQESIPLKGINESLHYSSDRSLGFGGNSTVKINLVTSEFPESLRSIEVEAKVAGTVKKSIVLPGEDTNYSFTWDGLDVFGREVTQPTKATISITYNFQSEYFVFPAQPDATAFNSPWAANSIGTSVPSRKAFSVVQNMPVLMNPPKLYQSSQVQNEIGGWTFSQHHQYNPLTKKLSLGTGQVIESNSLSPIVTNIAGGGQVLGDGGLALFSQLKLPIYYQPRPDGSAYITDYGNFRIRKISPNGIISTVAGTGIAGNTGDGGLATQAQIGSAVGLTFSSDGSLYFSDATMHVIRKISPNGIISTIAGNGVGGYTGDGGPAALAQINRPLAVFFLPDGSLLFSDSGNHVLRQILPNGNIRTYAGNGIRGYSGDGGPATDASFNDPDATYVDANGTLYIVDTGNHVIRKIAPGGIITTIVGNGTQGFSGDNGPAISAQINLPINVVVTSRGELYFTDTGNSVIRFVDLNNNIRTVAGIPSFAGYDGGNNPADKTLFNFPAGLYLMPDESLIVADAGNNLIRKIASPAPQVLNGQFIVASPDASEIFAFDSSGKHLQTLFAKTGLVKWQFNYNANNQLISMTDLDLNTVQITRNSNGQATQITGPYGQIYNVTMDSNGYLQRITQPTNEAYQIESTSTGLVTKFTHPKGNFSVTTYNGDGTLLQDTGPNGGTKAFAVNDAGKITMTTAMGRKQSVRQEAVPWTLSTSISFSENEDGSTSEIETTGAGLQKVDNVGKSLSHSNFDPRLLSNAQYIDGSIVTTANLGKQTYIQKSRNYTSRGLFDFDMIENISKDGQSVVSETFSTTNLTYQSVTGVGRISKTVIDQKERPILTQMANFTPVQTIYDSRGRVSQQQHGPRITTYNYDNNGNLNKITDPIGRVTLYVNDIAGKIIKSTLPDGRIILSSYDANSNLTNLNLPNNQDHLSIFNNLDFLSSYTAPIVNGINSITNYSFNLDRQRASIQRPDQKIIAYQYDEPFNRIKKIGTNTEFVDYNYDSKARLVSNTSSDNIQIDYVYDGTIPIQKIYLFGSTTINYSTVYTNPGLLIESESVNGQSSAMGYDADQLPINYGDLFLDRSLTSGLVNTAILENVTKSYVYNSFSELQSQSTNYSGANIFSESFSRDNIGRITQKTEVINNVTTIYNYSYDLSGRLTQVRRNNVLINNYSYDQNSNRIVKNNIQANYDAQDRIQNYGSTVYTFNDHGDVSVKTNGPQVTTYSFDVFGQLKTVNLSTGSAISYKTDGENKRFARFVNGVVNTFYSYNYQGQLVSEHNADGTLKSRYIYGTQAHSPDYVIKNDVKYSLIKDHLGSVRIVMNAATGAVAQQLNYDEFGIVTQDTNPQFQTFGYAGGLYDSSTGLLRFGARDYDAESGRWLQKDPIRFQGGDTNLYVYVGQDPINFVDPSGTFGVAGALIGGALGGISGAIVAAYNNTNIANGAIIGAVTGAAIGSGAGLFAATAEALGVSLAGQAVAAAAGAAQGAFIGNLTSQALVNGTVDFREVAITTALAPFSAAASTLIGRGAVGELAVGTANLPVDILSGTSGNRSGGSSSRRSNSCRAR